MKNLWKYSGYYLYVTGGLHCLYSIYEFRSIYSKFLSLPWESEKELSFWFFTLGIALIMFGTAFQGILNITEKPLPKTLGYSMTLFGIVGACFMLVSGFWLFIPQGIIIIIAKN